MRTAERRKRDLERLIYPALGSRPIGQIKRSQIVALLDKIQIENGPVMADRMLRQIGAIMNWHASRADDFRSPIVRGMARTSNTERARKRILTDAEIQAIWDTAGKMPGPFPAMITADGRSQIGRCRPAMVRDRWRRLAFAEHKKQDRPRSVPATVQCRDRADRSAAAQWRSRIRRQARAPDGLVHQAQGGIRSGVRDERMDAS